MASKPRPSFPPPGTLKAKLAYLMPRANILILRLSKGRFGGKEQDLPVRILHTVGRKSGKARQTPLLYLQDGEHYVVVASRGGSDAPPAWWLNLQAMPEATIEIKGSKRRVTARQATAEEKAGRGSPPAIPSTRLPGTHHARHRRDRADARLLTRRARQGPLPHD